MLADKVCVCLCIFYTRFLPRFYSRENPSACWNFALNMRYMSEKLSVRYFSLRNEVYGKFTECSFNQTLFHLGIRWHVYVTEQVLKFFSQIKRVNNLQSIIWCNTKPS